MDAELAESATGTRFTGWRDLIVLTALVLAAHATRMADSPFRGEESRRAQIAFEMLDHGDWIVPREQGEPFLSRAPLQNWLIAASTTLVGSRAVWACRLPSLLSVLLTTLLIYGYCRTFLSSTGAFAAAAAFCTMGEVISFGMLAETESFFVFLMAASLLLWHWGMTRAWPDWMTWAVGYAFVALGILTKGPQAPCYFVAATTIYLLLMGQWRRLLTPSHGLGVAICAAIVLAWFIPCVLRTDFHTARAIVINDSSSRFLDWKFMQVASHLVSFPLEIAGCTLPWCLLLIPFISKRVRNQLGGARPHAWFAALCLLIAFPTCWLPPGGNSRYFAPLYPCLAVLIGIVAQLALPSADCELARKAWRGMIGIVAIVMIGAVLAVVSFPFLSIRFAGLRPWTETTLTSAIFAAVSTALVFWAVQQRRRDDAPGIWQACLAAGCCMIVLNTGLLASARIRRAEDQDSAIARLKQQIPPSETIASVGHVHHLFAYLMARPIRLASGKGDNPVDKIDEWFCFNTFEPWTPPFAWQQVGIVSMDRNHHETPESAVIVGRRLKPTVEP